MSKYKVLKDNLKNVVGEEFEKTLPIIAEEYEAKIRRQAAEITRLLRENKELKEQMKFDLPTLISEEDRRRMDINKARAEGAEAAWELARKMISYSRDEMYEIFNTHNPYDIIMQMKHSVAAAKAAAWEKAKEEIKVGDIYRSNVGNYFVIRTTDPEEGVTKILFISSGEITPDYIKSYCTKTGRHIEIDGFLKQIGGE